MKDDVPHQLTQYREQIDALDAELIKLLARRFEIVNAVGRLKAEHNMDVVQTARAEAVIERNADLAKKFGLDPEFVRDLYVRIIDHAHALEQSVLGKQGQAQ